MLELLSQPVSLQQWGWATFPWPIPRPSHHLGMTKRNLSSLSSPWQRCQVAVHGLVTCCPPVWCHTEPRDHQAAIARLGVGYHMAICLDIIRFLPSLSSFKFTGSCFRVSLASFDTDTGQRTLCCTGTGSAQTGTHTGGC